MTMKKWFTSLEQAHGNASHHHTHGQGMCGDHWEHLGPFPMLFHCGVHIPVISIMWESTTYSVVVATYRYSADPAMRDDTASQRDFLVGDPAQPRTRQRRGSRPRALSAFAQCSGITL